MRIEIIRTRIDCCHQTIMNSNVYSYVYFVQSETITKHLT